ncbi:uncharacterized protein, partial [Littorina saxatilis]|uniref:uncharacterized protein n=1 Tax=Littorina saxatilis TaxID=31220 RepID=UPI0038B4C929
DDSDDTVEDVHNFDFLDDCTEDSTNVTGAQTSAEDPEGASVTSSPDPASETSECTKSPTSPEENTSKGVKIQTEGKRYFCIFCEKYFAQHLNRHLIKSHSEEADVAAAQALPEPQRSQALLIIRNHGRDGINWELQQVLERRREGREEAFSSFHFERKASRKETNFVGHCRQPNTGREILDPN